jgi:hypothetical protein
MRSNFLAACRDQTGKSNPIIAARGEMTCDRCGADAPGVQYRTIIAETLRSETTAFPGPGNSIIRRHKSSYRKIGEQSWSICRKCQRALVWKRAGGYIIIAISSVFILLITIQIRDTRWNPVRDYSTGIILVCLLMILIGVGVITQDSLLSKKLACTFALQTKHKIEIERLLGRSVKIHGKLGVNQGDVVLITEDAWLRNQYDQS